MSVQIPRSSMEILERIVEVTGLSMDKLQTVYDMLYNSDFIQADPQFKTPEARHHYTALKIHADNISRPKQSLRSIVPIGIDSVRISRGSRNKRGAIFVVELTRGRADVPGSPQEYHFRRVNCPDETSDIFERISLFNTYNVFMGQYRNSEDLVIDDRSKFNTPQPTGRSPSELMGAFEPLFGWKRTTIKDAVNLPSKLIESGTRSFVDVSDWRVIRGYIIDMRSGVRPDGTNWALYNITDETIRDVPVAMPDGTIRYPGMTVWLNPFLQKWAKSSVCDFYGSLALDREKGGALRNPRSVSLTAYQILPIFGRPLEEEPPIG